MFINASRRLTDSLYWSEGGRADAKWWEIKIPHKEEEEGGFGKLFTYWCISTQPCKSAFCSKSKHLNPRFHPKCRHCTHPAVDPLIKPPSGFNEVRTCLSFSIIICIFQQLCKRVYAQSLPSSPRSRSEETSRLVFIKHGSTTVKDVGDDSPRLWDIMKLFRCCRGVCRTPSSSQASGHDGHADVQHTPFGSIRCTSHPFIQTASNNGEC